MPRVRTILWVLFVSTCGVLAAARAGDGDGKGAVLEVPREHKTIQKAIDAAKDGDTVLIAPGTYSGPVRLKRKSIILASHFLTTGQKKHIEETIIQREGSGTVIEVAGAAGAKTRIVGLTIRNGGNGILCTGKGVLIEHCRVVACRDGIHFVNGEGVVRHCVLDGNRDDAIDIDGSSAVVVEHNTIRDSGDDGIENRLHKYGGRAPLNIVIRNNIITGSGEDGIQIIDHPGPSNRVIRIERNLISGTAMAAIGMMNKGNSAEDYRGASIQDPITLVNNTFLDNHYGVCGGGNMIVVNNVFARTEKIALKRVGGRSFISHNLFFESGSHFVAINVRKSAVILADPKLDKDGKPQAGSPCIDAGIATIKVNRKPVEIVPKTTYTGKAPDLGAFETPDSTKPE